MRAFHNVEDFRKVDEYYGKKRIPEDENFLNTLTRQFNIPRDRASVFADVFRAKLAFLHSFDIQTGTAVEADNDVLAIPTANETATIARTGKEKRMREFLTRAS